MLPCLGLRITLCRNSFGTLYVSQRHLSMKEYVEQIKLKQKRVESYKIITEEEKEPEMHDPLEYRDVGKYKTSLFGERNVKKERFDFNLLKRGSIFRGVKNDSLMGTMRNIVAKSKAKDQGYNPDRVRTLGPDLAAAHFIVCRGGGVKFVGDDNFIRGKVNRSYEVLPSEKDPHYKVEGIDFSKGDFVYEAVSNLADLKYLTWVSLRNCEFVDNWFLDHLSSVVPTLEYIDLTGCKKFDQFGLSCLYRFRKLKCVNVEDVSDTAEFNLACLTMEAEMPDFVFIGLKLKPTPKSIFND